MIHWADYRLLVVNTCKFSFLLQTAQDSNMYRVWLFLNLTVNYNPQMYITKWMQLLYNFSFCNGRMYLLGTYYLKEIEKHLIL